MAVIKVQRAATRHKPCDFNTSAHSTISAMKRIFLHCSLLLATLLLATACDKTTNEEPPVGEPDVFEGTHTYAGSLTLQVGLDKETIPDATIDIDLDAGTFDLYAIGEEMDVSIALAEGYEGTGPYQFSLCDATASGSDKDYNTYDWENNTSGSLTVTANDAAGISGSFEFRGYDFAEERTKAVKGSFSMKKE